MKFLKKMSAVITGIALAAGTFQTLPVKESLKAFADDDSFTVSLADINKNMGAGWNLGNSLEANSNGHPSETAWGNPVITQELISAVADAGFKTIRVPVSYLDMIDDENNYEVDSDWLVRVKEVVDYCYAEDLFVLINVHGDGYNTIDGGWFLANGEDQETICEKYEALWSQIADYFKDYDEHLIFESMNEEFDGEYSDPNPDYYANINVYNQIFVDTVRASGGNNDHRWLLVPGWNTNIEYTAGDYGFELPTDDNCTAGENRLMVSVHYYDPWDYCGDEKKSACLWGTQGQTVIDENSLPKSKKSSYGDEDYLKEQMQLLEDTFTSKGIPVIMGEYGAIDKSYADPEYSAVIASNRVYFDGYVAGTAVNYGVIPVYWDNGYNSKYGFGLFDRNTCEQTQPEIIKAIVEAVENADPNAGANIEVKTSVKSEKNSSVHAYIGIQTDLYTFRNSYNDADYGHDSEYFNTLIAWGENDEIIDTGASFTDAEITQDGSYTVGVSGYDFSQESSLNMLFVSTDFTYYDSMKVKNVVVKWDDEEFQIKKPAVMADDNGNLKIEIINKYNTELETFDYSMPSDSFEISFDITGTENVISQDSEDDVVTSVGAYIGVQSMKYTFRNSYNDADYGHDSEYFNTLIAWSEDNEIIKTDAVITDAVITQDGDYSVGISGYDFSAEDGFNMIFVSTNFTYYDGIRIKNVVLKCDDNEYEIKKPVVLADDDGNLKVEIINKYNTELEELEIELPVKSIEVSFSISGTENVISAPTEEAAPEVTEETAEETTVTESEETTPAETTSAPASEPEEDKGGMGGVVVVVVIVVAAVAGFVIYKKKQNRYY